MCVVLQHVSSPLQDRQPKARLIVPNLKISVEVCVCVCVCVHVCACV